MDSRRYGGIKVTGPLEIIHEMPERAPSLNIEKSVRAFNVLHAVLTRMLRIFTQPIYSRRNTTVVVKLNGGSRKFLTAFNSGLKISLWNHVSNASVN